MPGDPRLAGYLEGILSTMRHELGNAVNALKVTLDVLQENFDQFDEKKRKEYVKRASELLGRQQALIEAMKFYGHVNASDQKPMEFLSFWQHFLNDAVRRLEEEKIRLIHHLDAEPCMIMGNPVALDAVMTHLLDNALEAVDQAENPEIEMDVSRSDGDLLITIEDNGCGIRSGDLPRVFMPLYTTKHGKRGMGLPITLKLVTRMGGRMEIETLSGRGTRVRVWLRILGGAENEEAYEV